MMMDDWIETQFMLLAVQDWGQSEESGIAAVQAVLDAAGFKATATCRPVFGSIWPKSADGQEGDAATRWLRTLTSTMKRGNFESAAEHIRAAIIARQSIPAANLNIPAEEEESF